jgi:transcription elongation factor Elf1
MRPITVDSCPLCGRSLTASSSAMKQCTVCETSMSEDSIYCVNCGAKFELKTGSVTSISNGVEKSSSPFLTFEDTKAGVRLQYPSDWNKKVGHDVVVFSPKGEKYIDEASGIWLMGDKMYGNSLEEYAQEKVREIRPSLKVLNFLNQVIQLLFQEDLHISWSTLGDPQMASLL